MRMLNLDKNQQRGLPSWLQKVIALLMLLLLSPILIASIMCIKIESKGSALYAQTRVGGKSHRFKLFKLRSMYMEDDSNYVDVNHLKSDREGVCKKIYDDPRVTRVGRVIRKYSIDELPQLINVIKGDMDLIGPRPALVQEASLYDETTMHRLDVLPGLTGLWQISGRADTSFKEQVELDIRYVEEKNMLMDLKILLATMPVVALAKGAY